MLILNIPRSLHTSTHALGRLPHPISTELFVIHARDFNMNVNPVQQRAGNSLLVFGNQCWRAGAGLLCITIKPTWAGVHRGDKLKIRGKCERAFCTADGDHLIFHGLTQHFKDARAELGELIQEQNASVRKRDFSGFRNIATPTRPA
jgi:hypothetical protein